MKQSVSTSLRQHALRHTSELLFATAKDCKCLPLPLLCSRQTIPGHPELPLQVFLLLLCELLRLFRPLCCSSQSRVQ
eukprot:3424843-Amphidinium_carterae.1